MKTIGGQKSDRSNGNNANTKAPESSLQRACSERGELAIAGHGNADKRAWEFAFYTVVRSLSLEQFEKVAVILQGAPATVEQSLHLEPSPQRKKDQRAFSCSLRKIASQLNDDVAKVGLV